jgi:TetR/AcrR family transcriptional repressor of nem operon
LKDLKNELLNVGFDIISEHGFAGVGVMTIINAAGATKGSFYHHFKSKDEFGCILLDNYFEDHLANLNQFLMNTTMSRQERIQAYFQNWCNTKLTEEFQIKCLVVKLSGELSGTSSNMQQSLNQGATKIIDCLSEFFDRGIAEDEFSFNNSHEISSTIYSLWLGGTLLCALLKDRSILDNAMKETKRLMQ